ncbi:MarP family serine protease [Candidatus Saccharibacteria bacterium]|nr:MAG: MarP family serine protease [Candidatus Saccharibacteria bacterium]
MNIPLVDIVIVLLAIGALLRGYQIGFLRQFVSTIAFIIGLFPGSWLSTLAMDHVSGPSKPLAGLAVLLTTCFAFMTVGEILAVRLKLAVRNHTVQRMDNVIGAAMSVVTLLLGIWLASALFALAPPSSLQAQLKNSHILGTLNGELPPAATLLRSLNSLIDPNQSPEVFAGREPSPDARHTLPKPESFTAMLRAIEPSVVKIEGLGCGGIVDGSGFVFASELVATNAHVVAGVGNPKIRAGNDAFNTTVTVFDPSNDIAVLRVPGLNRPALTINRMNPAAGSAAFALGYPVAVNTR